MLNSKKISDDVLSVYLIIDYSHLFVWYSYGFLFSVSLNMNDIQETCQKNAAAALAVGRRDVAKVKI